MTVAFTILNSFCQCKNNIYINKSKSHWTTICYAKI